ITRALFACGGGVPPGAGTAAVLYIGIAHVQNGSITLGELLLIITYLGQLYGPMETVSKKAGDLQASLVSADRAFALLDQAPDVADSPSARPLKRAVGDVEF